MEWYQKAAGQGDVYSMHNIGFFYQKGQGVPVDYAKAEEWYGKAAAKGFQNSQYNLAVMYYNGQERPKDTVKAYAWLLNAAEKDYTPARNDLAIVEKLLTPEEKTRGRVLASTLLAK